MKKIYVTSGLLATFLFASLTAFAQIPSREDQQKQAEAKRAEFKKKAATLVASEEDRAKYADFLKAPNTGLIRLLPREQYPYEAYRDTKSVEPGSFVRKEDADLAMNSVHATHSPRGSSSTLPTLNTDVHNNLADIPRIDTNALQNSRKNNGRGGIRDGGAYYSFTRLTHEYGYGSDLSLERGQLNVGFAGADYGMLINLGDVPLESITLDTREAKLLATISPAADVAAARIEQRRFEQGTSLDGVSLKDRLPIQLHSTYLLRSIIYRESDVLVAFKVVEIAADGTPLILWKRLKRYKTPQLAGN